MVSQPVYGNGEICYVELPAINIGKSPTGLPVMGNSDRIIHPPAVGILQITWRIRRSGGE